MRLHLPQFDPSTPPLTQAQVGSATTVVANAGVLHLEPPCESAGDIAAERLLLNTFGQASGHAHADRYEQLRPAYLLGWHTAQENPSMAWHVVEAQLPMQWEAGGVVPMLPWLAVQEAVQAGWALAREQSLDAAAQAQQSQRIEALEGLLSPLVTGCMALANDVQALAQTSMHAFPYQVLQRHIGMLQGFAQELQLLMHDVANTPRLPRLGWWLRQRSAWLRFQGNIADWQYTEVMQLCEQREQQLIFNYRNAAIDAHSQVVVQVLQRQSHDLQRNMEKLTWVRTHWIG